jgi:outer membrane protein TolC
MGSSLDDVRAGQELAADESALEAAELALVRAQEQLGVLLAADGSVDAAEEPELARAQITGAADDAEHRRVDLMALDAGRQLAHRVTKDGWTDYLPTLRLSFSPIYTYPGTVFTPSFSWQVQLNLAVAFYDGGVREGLRRERRALEEEAQLQQEDGLRQLRSDLRVGDVATRRTGAELTHALEAARLAHRAVEIANLAYRAGATTNLELIDAERHARDADTAAAIAEDNARRARIDLLFTGGLLP